MTVAPFTALTAEILLTRRKHEVQQQTEENITPEKVIDSMKNGSRKITEKTNLYSMFNSEVPFLSISRNFPEIKRSRNSRFFKEFSASHLRSQNDSNTRPTA